MQGLLQPPATFRIDLAKITAYLLNVSHPVGNVKARFFLKHGFCSTRPSEFECALLAHPLTALLVKTEHNGYVEKFVFEGKLTGPNGPMPRICSVWKIEAGQSVGELVTAYPC